MSSAAAAAGPEDFLFFFTGIVLPRGGGRTAAGARSRGPPGLTAPRPPPPPETGGEETRGAPSRPALLLPTPAEPRRRPTRRGDRPRRRTGARNGCRARGGSGEPGGSGGRRNGERPGHKRGGAGSDSAAGAVPPPGPGLTAGGATLGSFPPPPLCWAGPWGGTVKPGDCRVSRAEGLCGRYREIKRGGGRAPSPAPAEGREARRAPGAGRKRDRNLSRLGFILQYWPLFSPLPAHGSCPPEHAPPREAGGCGAGVPDGRRVFLRGRGCPSERGAFLRGRLLLLPVSESPERPPTRAWPAAGAAVPLRLAVPKAAPGREPPVRYQ